MKKITHFATRKALLGQTPTWAHNAIAILVILTSIVQYIITQDKSIEAEIAERLCLYLNGLEMFAIAILRLFGVSNENLIENKTAHGTNIKKPDIS